MQRPPVLDIARRDLRPFQPQTCRDGVQSCFLLRRSGIAEYGVHFLERFALLHDQYLYTTPTREGKGTGSGITVWLWGNRTFVSGIKNPRKQKRNQRKPSKANIRPLANPLVHVGCHESDDEVAHRRAPRRPAHHLTPVPDDERHALRSIALAGTYVPTHVVRIESAVGHRAPGVRNGKRTPRTSDVLRAVMRTGIRRGYRGRWGAADGARRESRGYRTRCRDLTVYVRTAIVSLSTAERRIAGPRTFAFRAPDPRPALSSPPDPCLGFSLLREVEVR
ncbi:hypothetical protein PMIN03_011649 [Paraphaeosphaeria minitans]